MRSLFVFTGLLFAVAAIAADKPVVVAAVNPKHAAAPSARPAAAPGVKVMVTKETAVPEGSLEAFGAVGLPR